MEPPRKRLERLVIVDLECTCWQGGPKYGQEMEVIEIGICTLDLATRTPTPAAQIFVRPERSTLNEFCTQLTGITQAQADAGLHFKDACAKLVREYETHERVWVSYGDFDRRQFERQCRARNVAYPFGRTHWNVKNLFAILYGLAKEPELDVALEMLGLKFEGRQHCGRDDAHNIARLTAELLKRWNPAAALPAKA